MTLYHHDSRTYEEAATAAGISANQKFEDMIERGKASATATINKVLGATIVDNVIRLPDLTYGKGDGKLYLGRGSKMVPMHHNALTHLADRTSIPMAYVSQLMEADPDLLIDNLRRQAARIGGDALLRRAVPPSTGGEVHAMALLSTKYRRLDSRPLLEGFVTAATSRGGLPTEGIVTDTRIYLRMVQDKIHWLNPNEPVLFGICFGNSDFGRGRVTVSGLVLRLWCTNTAIREDSYRQVHLGRQITVENIALSEQTIALDTAAAKSAVGDVVEKTLSPQAVEKTLAALREAGEKTVMKPYDSLPASLTRSEKDAIVDHFKGPDVVHMPAGDTAYRLSQAVSWYARSVTDTERRVYLEEVAGSMF